MKTKKTLERTNISTVGDNSPKANEAPKNKHRERLQRETIAEQENPKEQINWHEQSPGQLPQNASPTGQESTYDQASHKRESVGQTSQNSTYTYRTSEKQKIKNHSHKAETKETKTVHRLNKIDNRRDKLENKQSKILRRKTNLEKPNLNRNSSDHSQRAIVKTAKRELKLEKLGVKGEKLENRTEKLETRQSKIIIENSNGRLNPLKFGKSEAKSPPKNGEKDIESKTENSPQIRSIKGDKNLTRRLEKLENKQGKMLRRKTNLEKLALNRNSSDHSQKAIVKTAKRKLKLEKLGVKGEKLENRTEKLETRQSKIIIENSNGRLNPLKFGKSEAKSPPKNGEKDIESKTENSPQIKPIKEDKNLTRRLEKLERKTEKHEAKRTEILQKTPKKKLTRLETGELAIKKGSRSTVQKSFYQSFHQPKKYLSNDIKSLEQRQGNEGVLLAHKTETFLKEKIAKPFARKHVPFGFDRKQYKTDKLLKKKNFAKAKKDILIKTSNAPLSSNKLSRIIHKRRIQKEMYKRHNVKRGVMTKLQGGARAFLSKLNPLAAMQQAFAAINAAMSSAFLAMKILLLGATLILFVIVPVITLVNVFSIFFRWGSDGAADGATGADPEVFFIAETNRYYSGRIADLRMSLIIARDTRRFPGYSNLRHVYIFDNTRNDGQTAYQRQIKLLGVLSAYYQDDLDLATAQAYIDGLIDTVFLISTSLVDLGWWEGGNHCSCCATYSPRFWVHYWILYINLYEVGWDAYIQNTLDSITDPDHQELALLQFEQYQELLGLAQIGANPFGDNVNWLTGISSVYGYRIMSESKELHNGIDIGCPINTPLFAIYDGVVTAVGYNDSRGHYIEYQIITEGLGAITVTYMHLNSSLVSTGEPIVSGQQIALSGTSGRSTGPHLHLEMSLNGQFINPLFLLEFPGLFD